MSINVPLRIAGPGRQKPCAACAQPLPAWAEDDHRPLCPACLDAEARARAVRAQALVEARTEADRRHAAEQRQWAEAYAAGQRERLAARRASTTAGPLTDRIRTAADYADGFAETFSDPNYWDGKGPDDYAEAEALAVRDLLTGLGAKAEQVRLALEAYEAEDDDRGRAAEGLARAVRAFLGKG
jgi:hypothetical protein